MNMKKETTKKKIDIKDLLFYIAILVVPVLQVCIFYIYVNFNSIMLSFKAYEKIELADGYKWGYALVGFSNYGTVIKDLFTNSILTTSITNSLKVFVCTFVFGVFMSSIFAYYIFKKFPLSGTFRVILFLPQIISSVIMVILFKYLAEDLIPEIVFKLLGLKMKGLLSNIDTKFVTIVLYSIFIAYGSQILLYTGAMAEINQSVIEAGHLDGVGYFREYVHIVFPAIWPTFTTLTITSIAGIFSNSIHLYTLFGGNVDYSLYTMGYFMFYNTTIATYADYPYLATMGVTFTLVLFPVTMSVRKLMLKYGPSAD